ncbi:hypothetical protein K0U91_08170 [Chryseobacterium chendengshani]|uniref:hypothetical protein n=1 Tax=Chryseobacterium sp. LJ668 TaxID=2864040 RepID=UPI001C6925C3|nr:hypothetical protein [Chryseobacterium sp. LJ668]MBW8524666.1 hypothetical protein [Chryseobacterium sp. LJ668]QYK15067.1 hypothetical protein K0U91_08170 [Chryseobacterium sp. LJ668]
MDLNIFNIIIFIILTVVYLIVRKFFKRVANLTGKLGDSEIQEKEVEIARLNTKIIELEQQISHKS